MGAFLVNFHVRSDDSAAVQQAAAEIGARRLRVESPANGWVSLYEEQASHQDEEWIARLAQELSSHLRTACVAFLVHDSDIARYWLSDQGQLLDEYNSIPDYFEEVPAAEKQRLQGRPEMFLRYCRPGITSRDIETVLRADVVFAEDTIQQLAKFLGIGPDRALDDFDHPRSGGGAGGLGNFDEDDDVPADDADSTSPSGFGGMLQNMQRQLAGMFVSVHDQAGSAQSNALVEAAAGGNIEEIDRLAGTGTDVNAPGLLPLQTPGSTSFLTGMGLAPKVPLSPLMAAASRGQATAVQRLLVLGANVSEVHPLYGSALHVAAQSGSVETVRSLLTAGIPAGVKNRQGLTPRAMIQAVHKQIEMAKQMAKTMPQLQQVYDRLAAKLTELPEAGWAACEKLLLDAGG